jgi:RNA polymerase sigma factor (sigma-70 family)
MCLPTESRQTHPTLLRCVRPPRPATRPVTMPFARCNATTRPPTSTDCCWVEVVQPSENGAPYNSLVWYHFTSPGERPCPPMFPHSPDGSSSWLSDLRTGRPRGWQRLVQCSSRSSVTGAGTPGCRRPTWRGRDGGLTIPWPSSNWWIKTSRIEDDEVEAAMVGRLKAMPTSPLSVVIQNLLADLRPDGDGMTDRELLARFLRSRDEDALAALVRKHARMVWGVCCRLLHQHDAEDAFQSTFLVLVRKAADVPSEAVANWLYGVARQTAIRLRATAAKRRRRETQVVNMPEPTVPELRDADLQVAVDEELSRLPDHYRGVVVLCYLEGMTRKEAVRQLGIPEGTVASRLARARVMLARRLTQRGIVMAGGSVAAVLSAGSASASAPPALVASTIKVITLLSAGEVAATGMISAVVSDLTEGVVKAMFMTKIKSVLTVVLVVGLALGGIGAGFGLTTIPVAVARTEPPNQPPAIEESPRSPVATKKDEKPPNIVEKPDVEPPAPLAARKEKWQKVLDTTDFKFNEMESGSTYSMKICQMGDYKVDAIKEKVNANSTPLAPGAPVVPDVPVVPGLPVAPSAPVVPPGLPVAPGAPVVPPGLPVAPGAPVVPPGAPVVPRAVNVYATTFKFKRDGKEVLKIEGNDGGPVLLADEADFRIEGDVLYLALRSLPWGGTVTAHDLKTGKQLWSSPLKGVPCTLPMSCVFNAVSLKVLKDSDKSTDGVVWVSGHETYGDYYEVLDKKTGTMLARKVYREGFGK